MEPTEDENHISGGSDKPANPIGRGDFSLKPAGRRKGISKMVFFAIGGGILFVIILGSLFTYAVISSMDKAEPVIDEKSVKAAPVLQQDIRKDDSMAAAMDKVLGSQTPPPVDTPSPPPSPAENNGAKKGDTRSRESQTADLPNDTSRNNASPYAQPQQEEQLFAKINRFESTGMSAGSGGGSYASASADSDSSGGSDKEARLRQFISADPNELARNLVNGTGGSGSAASGGLTGNGGGSLLDNLDGNQYAMAKARLAPSPKFLLNRRTTFQCVLDTGIRTDYPGFVECHLAYPLYSADGSVILARAGAKLYGEQKIEVKQGQSSVFTTWNELETQSLRPGERAIRASLNGLGTDSMGRSGTDAEVDNHWGQKIGGAVMLSTFKDVLNGGMNALSKNSNNQFTFNNTENSTEDLATKILDSTIGIPPTAYINPGTLINVVVAQDIDFSSVYQTRR